MSLTGVKAPRSVAAPSNASFDVPAATLELARHPVDRGCALALLDPKELVVGRAGFLPDARAGLQRHQHQLQVPAGVQRMPEGAVFFGQLFDAGDPALRFAVPSR
jgi:hypothetical protein